jgi:hypothetical protein
LAGRYGAGADTNKQATYGVRRYLASEKRMLLGKGRWGAGSTWKSSHTVYGVEYKYSVLYVKRGLRHSYDAVAGGTCSCTYITVVLCLCCCDVYKSLSTVRPSPSFTLKARSRWNICLNLRFETFAIFLPSQTVLPSIDSIASSRRSPQNGS